MQTTKTAIKDLCAQMNRARLEGKAQVYQDLQTQLGILLKK